MALFNRNRFRALASAFMLSAVLAGCGNGGGGGLPGTTFRSGNITADSPELTALTADPNTAANRVNIAGNIVDVVDDGDDTTTDTPALSFAGVIDAGGNPAAPTDDAATADVDESEETDAEVLARLDSLWIVSGGVVNNIVITAPAAGDLHIQNFEVITVDGGMVRGDISNGDTPTTYTVMSGTVGVAAVVEVVGVVDDPATTEVDETVVAVTGVAASGGDITGGAGADIFNLIGGTILGTVSGGAEADTFIVAGNIVDDSDTAMDGEQRALTISAALDGGGGDDTFWLNEGGVVRNIANATGTGDVNLASFEAITINGGTVNGNITNAAAATIYTVMSGTVGTPADPDADPAVTASDGNITGGAMIDTFNIEGGTIVGNVVGGAEDDIFNLEGGTVSGNVEGGAGADSFVIGAGITIGGMIDGGADADTLSLATGFTPTAANLFGGVLTLTLNGGGSLALTLANIATENIDVGTLTLTTMRLPGGGDPMTPTTLTFTGSASADTFAITTDLTGSPAMPLESVIDGLTGDDTLQLNTGAVVASVAFSNTPPTGGAVNLQSVETITLNGGRVTGNITGPAAATTFNLTSGTVGGNVVGGAGVDAFVIGSGITITGFIDGGAGTDTFAATAAVNVLVTTATDTTANAIRLRNVETITLSGGDDTLILLEGTVGGNINMGGGNDEVRVTGGVTFGGTIDGGAGTGDRFVWGDGLTTSIVSVGTNLFAFATGDHDGNGNTVPNPTGFEVFVIDGGTIGGYSGSGDDNVIELRSGEVTGTINTVAGNNRITLLSGMVGTIFGGSGNDEITVTGGVTFGGTISGGAGTGDRFVWGAGLTTTGVSVSGTTANPTFAFAGTDHDTITPGDNLVPVPSNFEVFVIDGGTIGAYTGNGEGNVLELRSGSVTGAISTVAGNNRITLLSGMVGGNIFSGSGNDTFTLSGGTLTGNVDGGAGADTFNLEGGTITGNVTGGAGADVFNLEGGMTSGHVDGGADDDTFNLYTAFMFTGDANSFIDGGGGTSDVLNYAGAPASATDFTFAGSNGLASDADIRDDGSTAGSVSVRNIESQTSTLPTLNSIGAGAGLRDLTVRGIEVLGLSPALNLYGALSDALMQFGQQTAQGFALADLNLATGRATSLVSKDSPFTKGRIWAHKITHSGNGKGSIGLNLTGLTARADSDYDYEMSLTQHGFDAPLATTRLGAFNLRAVSHTMTGVIETNVAEANVSGYGAGVALLWNSGVAASKASASAHHKASASAQYHHGLSAHITSLAGAYEVEAHTSPLNPRAVVSEITEGSFSAINAVVSAGVADTRKLGHSLVLRTTADIVWQTLSLDDFSETGSGGIIINFDKATRFTARVGAGLEGEHWFSDVVFVHETSSGGTLSSGLSQDYRQDDGTAIEMKLGGKLADLATGLTLKAYAGLRTSLITSDSIDPSAHLALNWRF